MTKPYEIVYLRCRYFKGGNRRQVTILLPSSGYYEFSEASIPQITIDKSYVRMLKTKKEKHANSI